MTGGEGVEEKADWRRAPRPKDLPKVNSRLRQARLAANLTQDELAALVGLSRRGYQYFEDGAQAPNVGTALWLARVLGSTIDDLFTLDEDERTGAMRVLLELEVATADEDPDRRSGMTEAALERLVGALSEAGFALVAGPEQKGMKH